MQPAITRAGRYLKQPAGYSAFIPAPLPPDPPLEIGSELVSLLSEADRALGRLDGVSRTLPNPDLFVAMYVRREAVFSSQIEGTQSSLEDVLEFELDPAGRRLPTDVVEVVNYVQAMNHGLERLTSLPLSLRLIREIHAKLLEGVRGSQRLPGEFRKSQNWIGPAGASLAQAAFVPPPVNEMQASLGDLERFLHVDTFPPLIHAGLVHAQFETIHPFLDGNGRIGRLLITFLLVQHNVLHRPLLYLSHYLKRYRAEYYDRLTAIRHAGDWEGWLRFFLRGAAETGREATSTAMAIIELRDQHRTLIQEHGARATAFQLLDLLFQWPVLNVNLVKQRLNVSFATSNKLVERFQKLGLLEETTRHRRNRRYRYTPYLRLFEGQEIAPSAETVQTTESAEKGAEP